MKHVNRYLRASWMLAFLLVFALSAQAQNLTITKTVDKPAPLSGDVVTFTIEVENTSVAAVDFDEVTVVDTLQAGLSLVSVGAMPAGFVDNSVGSNLEFEGTGLTLAQGDVVTFTVKAEVLVVTPLVNCADVADSDPADTDADDDRSCVALTPMEQSQFWMPANLDAGSVTAIAEAAGHPLGGNGPTFFVGTDGGGVYRTVDAGENWFPTDLVDRHVRGMAVSDRSDALWVVTYDDAVYRSADYGSSYVQPFVSPANLLSIAIDTHNPNNTGGDGDVWIGSDGNGVFYSNDAGTGGGNNFGATNSGLPLGAGRIIRSLAVLPAGSVDDAVQADDRDRVFAGTHGRGIWYMDYNGGNTITGNWVDASNGTLDKAVVHAIAIDGTGTGATIYVGTNDGVYKATNGTFAWSHVLDATSAGVPSWDSAPVVRSIEIYTDNATTYIVAGTDGKYVYVSDDDGATWTQQDGLTNPLDGSSGLQSKTVLSLHYGSNDVLYAGTQDKGVHSSDDDGETFEQISNVSLQDGYRVIQDLVYHDGRLYGASYGFGVIMSDDVGQPILNWTRVNNGLDNPFVYALLSKNDDYLFAGTWGSGVYRSTDDGENWLFSGLANRIVYDLAVNDDGHVYAGTDRGEVARSIDNGLTWQETGVATTAIWSLAIDGDKVYAGTFGQGMYLSEDGGFTWTQTNLQTGYVFDITINSGAIYAATAEGVLVSMDDFQTWDTLADNVGLTSTEVHSVAVFTANATTYVLAGTWGGGVFLYDSGNDVWTRDGMPGGHITVFAVNPATGDVYVAAQGEGVSHRHFDAAQTVATDDAELPGAYSLEQNYPNPFNPTTAITFALPEAAPVRLTVYDALGRQVRVLVDGVTAAGTHTVAFDAHGLPSGTYLYRLETPSRTLNQTMILMK